MASSYMVIDPDDPQYRGKTWDAVEKALDDRDKYFQSLSGFDLEYEEDRGPSWMNPSKVQYSKFPWEEEVDPFDKPASCTAKDWKHTCLSYKIGQQCATLKFTKGAQNNTIDPAMLDALQDAIMDLRNQPTVRVVIIKSEGKLFSNGFDPKYLQSETNMTEKDIIAIQMQFAKILYYLSTLQQYTIACIQGSVMGAAVGLVCACDLVVSVKGAFFAMSETKLGAVATTSIPYISKRITYVKNVYQLVLAGASLSAETAREYGIVNVVVEDEKAMDAEAKQLCTKMGMCAPGAVAVTKEVIHNTIGVPPSIFMMNYVASLLKEVRNSPESKHGLAAIMAKKRPAWTEKPIAEA